jgi:TupA-like ATPgrasp
MSADGPFTLATLIGWKQHSVPKSTSIMNLWEIVCRRTNAALPDWLFIIRKFKDVHGRFPNVLWPTTFNERVTRKMIFDRRPILTAFADKLRVRDYVAATIGPDYLPEIYYITEDPSDIPFQSLPEQFVIKANHGSGWNIIVKNRAQIHEEEIIRTTKNWLAQNYYYEDREWCYKNIKPKIFIERFLETPDQDVPEDYKLFTFNGRVEFIQVDMDRFTGHKRNVYDRAWRRLDIRFGYPNIEREIPSPKALEEMIGCAERLGAGLDFIRADFYYVDSRLIFGEITNFPEAGHGQFSPADADRVFGNKWAANLRRG